MAGDLTSSFIKRRLGIASSGRALGLDQVPEALLPLLVCYGALGLGPLEVLLTVTLFSIGSPLISPLMFRIGIRRHPH
jgi:CDP-2,3-bis-(O-geranylgeranyl)-sn-glycerol synthase